MSADVRTALPARALDGETPTWCPDRRRLFWVDIRKPAFHAYDPATGQDECWNMPAWIGSFGLTGSGALVALRTGLFLFDIGTGALEQVARPPCDPRRFALNDGRCDPAGRFLVGAMHQPLGDDKPGGPNAAPLWRWDGGDCWAEVSDPVQTSNGLAWSPDGRTMYHSDTARHAVWAYDYDPGTGAVANKRVFARVEEGGKDGGPDGAAVDRDGFYWCAAYGGGCLLRFDPGGTLERRVAMPVQYPTMPAFGGEDLRTVFVTSANWPLSPEELRQRPQEGNLFAFEAPAPGLPGTQVRITVGQPDGCSGSAARAAVAMRRGRLALALPLDAGAGSAASAPVRRSLVQSNH